MTDNAAAIMQAAERVLAAGERLDRLTSAIQTLDAYDVASVRAALFLAMDSEIDVRGDMVAVVDVLASVFGTLTSDEARKT